MADYSKTTNFTAKDSLTSGDPNKVIKGATFDTEFDALVTASATKSNKIVSSTTNNVIKQSSGGDLVDAGYSFSGLSADVTASAAELNFMDGVTISTQDINEASFPSGTLMLFQQTAAPTGWTKETTHDDKALRVITGTVSSGGTKAFTTAFGSSKTSDSHVLSTTEIPAHSHSVAYANTNVGNGSTIGSSTIASNAFKTTGNAGGGAGHTHNLTNFDLQYVDLIIASKD